MRAENLDFILQNFSGVPIAIPMHMQDSLPIAPTADNANRATLNYFLRVSFTTDDHKKTRFPLLGAHIAVPCVACHIDQKVNARVRVNFIGKERYNARRVMRISIKGNLQRR